MLMLFLLYILWVFLGWELPTTQIRTLAAAVEASGWGLVQSFLLPVFTSHQHGSCASLMSTSPRPLVPEPALQRSGQVMGGCCYQLHLQRKVEEQQFPSLEP